MTTPQERENERMIKSVDKILEDTKDDPDVKRHFENLPEEDKK